jgi:hypothetical protein
MNLKTKPIVFFPAAIRGNRQRAEETSALIQWLKEQGITVLNEHVGTKDPIETFSEKSVKQKIPSKQRISKSKIPSKQRISKSKIPRGLINQNTSSRKFQVLLQELGEKLNMLGRKEVSGTNLRKYFVCVIKKTSFRLLQ